jgi:predicted nucleotidyltransferase
MANSEDVTNWTAQQRIDAFKEEFVSRMMRDPHVTDVRFFGSAHETWRWRQGHSNVDIIVEGEDIPMDVRLKGVKLLEKLNYKYCLGLEKVPFYHPTPFYSDSLAAEGIGYIAPKVQFLTDPVRSVMKSLGSRGKWPISHGNYWKIVNESPTPMQRVLIL